MKQILISTLALVVTLTSVFGQEGNTVAAAGLCIHSRAALEEKITQERILDDIRATTININLIDNVARTIDRITARCCDRLVIRINRISPIEFNIISIRNFWRSSL